MRQSSVWALALAISAARAAASAEDWAPHRGDLRDLIQGFRASVYVQAEPFAQPVPAAHAGGCHALIAARDYRIAADGSGKVLGIAGPDRGFAASLEPAPSARAEGGAILLTDRYGGDWAESAWTAEIVRMGGTRPPGPLVLEPRHEGYLLAWPEETAKGCGGVAPKVTVLRWAYAMEAARRLVEAEEFARRNRGVQPTAKPRGGDGPPAGNPKG